MQVISVKSQKDFEKYMKKLATIDVLREKKVDWLTITRKLKLGSETAARRFYKKLQELRDYPPEGLAHLDFTRDALKKTVKATKTRGQRYIVTTITAKAETNREAFLALLGAAKELDAKLVLLLGRSHNKPMKAQIRYYDPWLKQYAKDVVMVTEYKFNKNIMAVDLQINPQQLNPLTGVKGINWGEDSSSVIVASTQICWETVARGNGKSPRVIVGTGSISEPKYQKDYRTGRMAEQNHDCGAMMLEVANDSKFFMRPLEIDPKTGTFFDIAGGVCKKYTPEGSFPAKAEGWVLGDKHIGYNSQKVWDAQKRLAKMVKPENFVLHDLIDGCSVTHHTWKKTLKRLKSPFFSIEEELAAVKGFLEEMSKILPAAKGFVVDSNHHDHITRYLEEGRYVHDKINYDIAHRMIVDILDDKNPLQTRCDPSNKFLWTGDKDDYYIEKVNIAIHGHRGANGSKGSLKSVATFERSAIIGHSHTPGWYRGVLQVGHSSDEDHEYNQGPSSWATADGLIFPGGLKTLIIYVDGEFHL